MNYLNADKSCSELIFSIVLLFSCHKSGGYLDNISSRVGPDIRY